MKLIRLLWAGMAVAVLLVGCGGGSDGTTAEERSQAPKQEQRDLKKMQITVEGFVSASDAGILMAYQRGYYADAGLDMTVYGPARPEYAIDYGAEKASNIVVSQMPQVVLAQTEGKPVVAFGSVLPEPTMAMIWLPDSDIGEVADLEGKTIAYPGVPFQKDFLEYVLRSAGLTLADVTLKRVRYNSVSALAQGRADAAFGASWSADGATLESRGLKPVITKVADLGIPDFEELVLVTQRDSFAREPKVYSRFLEATTRGGAAANEDHEAAALAIATKTAELIPVQATQAGVEATVPLLSKTGEIDRAKLKHLVDWMHEQGMIRRKPALSALIAGNGDE